MKVSFGLFRAAIACASIVSAASCDQQRSLINLDVTGSRTFDRVTLRLDAGGMARQTFSGVSLGPTTVLKVGLYVPADVTGTVIVTGQVDDGVCLRGRGQVSVPGVGDGEATPPVALVVMAIADCQPIDPGGSGGSGGGTGGGDGGTGGVGTGGRIGTGGAGTGGRGTAGTGTGGAGTGGHATGGNPGTGGAGTGGRIGTGGAGTGGAGTGGRIGTGGAGTGGAGTGGRIGTGGAGTGGAGTGGAGTGGNSLCPGTLPPNFGQACGHCGGTIACSGSCSKSDTVCAPTGEWYHIRNQQLGDSLYLDTWGGGFPNEAFMTTPCCTGSAWRITATNDGYYLLSNLALGPGRLLEPYPDGHKLFMGVAAGTSAQKWTITALGNGYYRFTNAALGETPAMSIDGDPPHDPAMSLILTVPAEAWKITKI